MAGDDLRFVVGIDRSLTVTPMAARKPRLSLTKTQVQAGVGAELLALCQSMTADGRLTDDEIAELRIWLDTNRSSDLPSVGFLVTTVERILADGIVTAEERRELYGAVEAVLPLEARRVAAGQRRSVEAEEKVQAREEREAQKQQERAERERQRPLDSANFMVAGVHYEGRWEVIRRHVSEGDVVYLARDPENKFSRNAIEVRLKNGMQIGFVPEDFAPDLAPLLDRGCPHTAYVTKVLTGGRAPIPVVQAYIHHPDADLKGLVFPADVPPKRASRKGGEQARRAQRSQRAVGATPRSRGGCLSLVLIVALPMAVVAARVFGLLG